MGHRKVRIQSTIIDSERFGVSFSLKQCRAFNIDPEKALLFLLKDIGFRRFRLMSYWNEHEINEGNYNFAALDEQVELIEKYGGKINLCLGVRQPRWPESHWPDWAINLNENQRQAALSKNIATVVERYKNHDSVVAWQLENEALNRSFGENGDFNRQRLLKEFRLVKRLDSKRPIIMSTSNTWGLPVRKPRPEQFGFTFYQIQHVKDSYSKTIIPWWWYRFRAFLIHVMSGRKSFIHELQAEPWGPKAIWEMSKKEQDKSMDIKQLQKNIQLAKKTNLYPIDLWGGEWWYWRYVKDNDSTVWKAVKEAINRNQ